MIGVSRFFLLRLLPPIVQILLQYQELGANNIVLALLVALCASMLLQFTGRRFYLRPLLHLPLLACVFAAIFLTPKGFWMVYMLVVLSLPWIQAWIKSYFLRQLAHTGDLAEMVVRGPPVSRATGFVDDGAHADDLTEIVVATKNKVS